VASLGPLRSVRQPSLNFYTLSPSHDKRMTSAGQRAWWGKRATSDDRLLGSRPTTRFARFAREPGSRTPAHAYSRVSARLFCPAFVFHTMYGPIVNGVFAHFVSLHHGLGFIVAFCLPMSCRPGAVRPLDIFFFLIFFFFPLFRQG